MLNCHSPNNMSLLNRIIIWQHDCSHHSRVLCRCPAFVEVQYIDKDYVGAKKAAFLDVWVKAGTDSKSQMYGPSKKPSPSNLIKTASVLYFREARFKQA